MSFYEGKNVLVAGGTGLIGKQLVDKLIAEGSNVRTVSLDDPKKSHPKSEFLRLDLTSYNNCLTSCKGMEYVFNLMCVKGSPKFMKEHPASVFDPMLLFNTNLLRAARDVGVKRYLYTSTLGVYASSEMSFEDDVWETFPSDKDRFAGWAKRMGELQAEAYQKEYGWDKIAIIRPANVYGPHDNFDPESSLVIPSLIRRVIEGENPLVVWGNGKQVRDFVYSEDIARGMMMALEHCPGPEKPINLGSGREYSIINLVETIVKKLDPEREIVYDSSESTGDRVRLMDVSRARELLGWEAKTSLEEGISKTIEWYVKNKEEI